MFKYFNDTVILSSQNPEAILTYVHDASDYYITVNSISERNVLYANGIDLYDCCTNVYLYGLQINDIATRAAFHIYTRSVSEFDITISFNISDSTGSFLYNDYVTILNRPTIIAGGFNTYENKEVLVDNETSYLVLRTNPKFTGNIKLIVDVSENLYLDTFKVSDILSNKKYRKQSVSSESVLSSDIRNVFTALPLGELYRVDSLNTLDITIPKTEYKDQYRTTYNYGARLFEDELYAEDNALLAPIWINSKLPDYFCVFRMPGIYNVETYNNDSLSYLASKYFENSDIIKTWSLKNDSGLGKYLETHRNDLIKFPAPVFLSLTDPSISTADADPNTWYGITVDKGVLAGRSETPYYFNKTINNFTELNAFVSNGFERNNLLSANLLNIEYIFDDNDVSAYTMNRYFGLYLTENILYKVAYYNDFSTGNVRILSLDGRDLSTFINSSVFTNAGDISPEYRNRLFVINDGKTLKRITSVSQINGSEGYINNYVSNPNNNIFSNVVNKKEYTPFITLRINNHLHQGEHLRIINRTQNKIWEAYGIADVSNCQKYVSTYTEPGGYPTIYQTNFLVTGSIEDQIDSIKEAFHRFEDYNDNYFTTGLSASNWTAILLNDVADSSESWEFQRITAQTLNDWNNASSGFNSAARPDDITFFGRFTPEDANFETIAYDAQYGPINFELYGDRRTIFIDLFNRGSNLLYNFDASEADNLSQYTLYQGKDNWYKLIINFDISSNFIDSYQYIQDPYHEHRYLIQTAEEIQTVTGFWNSYDIQTYNISLMGVNPVKDIDYTVYDSSTLNFTSEYFYKREDDISTYFLTVPANTANVIEIKDSYQLISGTGYITIGNVTQNYSGYTSMFPLGFNTFNSSAYISATTDTLITYNLLDGSYNYTSYKTGSAYSEENIYDYYNSTTRLKYGLTVPTVSKWVGLGTDCRNNPFRLIFNSNIFDSVLPTNFIPSGNNYTQEITYPVFKYLTPGTRAWQSYIFHDLNDVMEYVEDGITYRKTIKNLIFEKPYNDIFSKLIFSNNEVDDTINRSVLCYYNDYKQSIDILFMGLSISISIKDVAKNTINIKDYNRYKFSFISTSSRNAHSNKPIEIIINENTKTVLMIWYQGADVLNYNKRYSNGIYGSPTYGGGTGKSIMDDVSLGVQWKSLKNGPNWTFEKTPFIVRTDVLNKPLVNMYEYKDFISYDVSLIRPYAQLSHGLKSFDTTFNAFTNLNTLINYPDTLYAPYSYNTFSKTVDYSYSRSVNTYGDSIVNYGYLYQNNWNLYANNTCNINTLTSFLNNENDYIMAYIIRENVIYDNLTFKTCPFYFALNTPRQFNNLTTYNGWYTPKFDSILDFKSNEDKDLMDILNLDFTLSNTNLRSYKNIDQLWYNKVTTRVSETDVSAANAIDYKEEFNVFNALWDANYYTLQESTLINGYESSLELPSFFGSKLIKLPDYLVLDSFDVTVASVITDTNNYILSYNLTKIISNLFKDNKLFLNNWAGLAATDAIINSYINDTIISYYNISISKIKLNLYTKSYATSLLYYTYDTQFSENIKINYTTKLSFENKDWKYLITIPKNLNYSYYVKFTLFEK